MGGTTCFSQIKLMVISDALETAIVFVQLVEAASVGRNIFTRSDGAKLWSDLSTRHSGPACP